jgi:hypothetical protein
MLPRPEIIARFVGLAAIVAGVFTTILKLNQLRICASCHQNNEKNCSGH